jgi:hypothetical protein
MQICNVIEKTAASFINTYCGSSFKQLKKLANYDVEDRHRFVEAILPILTG